MNIRSRVAEPRRLVLPLAIVGVAIAVAAGLTIDPAGQPKSSMSPTAKSGYATSTIAADRGREDDTAARASKAVSGEMGGGVTSAVAPADMDVTEANAPDTGIGVPNVDLKVIQTGDLNITVKRNSLDTRLERVGEIAQSLGGYVVDMQVADARGSVASGTVTLRIPGARFGAAMNQLGDLGKVANRQVTSTDVTEEYVDTKSRLRHDTAVEARLIELLAKAKTVGQVLAVQDRLDAVQEQIEIEKGRIGYLDKMTAYSTIRMTLTERGKKAASTTDNGIEWGFGDATRTSLERFSANIGSAIVWFGGALPTLLLLGAGALVLRRTLRRRNATTVSTEHTPET